MLFDEASMDREKERENAGTFSKKKKKCVRNFFDSLKKKIGGSLTLSGP